MKVFLDTNVLVYAHKWGPKTLAARAILAQGGFVSVQVLNEFVAVCRRKAGMSWEEIEFALKDMLEMFERTVPITVETHIAALALAQRHGLHIYDASIVASASLAGCDVLYTEDMQHGRAFGGLTIRNPFRTDA